MMDISFFYVVSSQLDNKRCPSQRRRRVQLGFQPSPLPIRVLSLVVNACVTCSGRPVRDAASKIKW